LKRKKKSLWPKKRSHHIAVCLGYGGQHKRVLISGGLGITDNVFSDVLILDPESGKWEKVSSIVHVKCTKARC